MRAPIADLYMISIHILDESMGRGMHMVSDGEARFGVYVINKTSQMEYYEF